VTPHLLLLTGHPELHAPRRLAQAAAALGVSCEFVAPDRWWAAARRGPDGANSSAAAARDLAGAALIARPGPFQLIAILRTHRRLAESGAVALQSRRALLDACDQWRSWCRLARAGVALPRTGLVRHAAEIDSALARVPGPPWFLKGRRGSQGSHVVLATTPCDARRVAHLFWGTGASVLLQEDRRASGRVERHFIVAGRVVASAIAHPAPGEHRTNAHRGGRFEMIDPTESRAADVARRATAAIGLPFAAVDTIGGSEPVVLDVNASPGFEALEAASGRDLARELIASLLLRLEPPAPAALAMPFAPAGAAPVA